MKVSAMDLADLEIFRCVVQAGGITRAAEKLNRVQSNVTTRVRQLEADLGVELFIRDGKRLHLSTQGKLLLDYADRLIGLAQEARDGELDAALVAEPIPDAPFEKIPLYDEELVIIAAAKHPPIKSPKDANGLPILAFESGCPYRQRLENWFAGSGEMSARVIETSSYHAILGCAVAGMGIAMVPRMVLKTFPDAKLLSIHPVPQVGTAPTVLIRRKGAISPKVNALIEVLKEAAAAEAGPKTRRKNGA